MPVSSRSLKIITLYTILLALVVSVQHMGMFLSDKKHMTQKNNFQTLPDTGKRIDKPEKNKNHANSLTHIRIGDSSLSCNRQISAHPSDILLLMFANTAFIPLTKNWICNTGGFKGVHNRTLIVVDTLESLTTLASLFEGTLCVDQKALKTGAQKLPFGTLGYWVITQHRTHLLLDFTLIGIPILLIESDALWVQNPLLDPLMTSQNDLILYSDGTAYGGGWLKMAHNPKVTKFISQISRFYDLEINTIPHTTPYERVISLRNDQDILTQLIRSNTHNLTVTLFPECRYVNGQWYDGGVNKNSRQKRSLCKDVPGGIVVIQNNWIVGNSAKIDRAKRWGHWFLKDDDTCLEGEDFHRTWQKMMHTIKTGKQPT